MSMSLIGAPVAAKGQLVAGQMTSDSLNRQADNLEQQAADARQKGEYDAFRQQIIAGKKIGTSIAAYGANGVAANSGSVLDVIEASHRNAELDRLNILHGADVRAINYLNQASMNRFGGESAVKGSYYQALGSLFTGAGNSFGGSSGPSQAGESAASSGGGEGAGMESGAAGADTGAAAAAVV